MPPHLAILHRDGTRNIKAALQELLLLNHVASLISLFSNGIIFLPSKEMFLVSYSVEPLITNIFSSCPSEYIFTLPTLLMGKSLGTEFYIDFQHCEDAI